MKLLQCDIRILLHQFPKEALLRHETAMSPATRVGFGPEVTGPPQAVRKPNRRGSGNQQSTTDLPCREFLSVQDLKAMSNIQ